MKATNEAWISDSLARLEQLETQREHLASAGRTEALAELDEEIKSLYEVLESAADDDDPAANNSPASTESAVPHPAFGPTPVPMASQQAAPLVSHAISASQMPSPFAAPEAALAAPAAHLTHAPTMHVQGGDDDVRSGGKGGIIAVVVLLLAAGGGGWWYMNRPVAAPVVEAPAGPAKIIQAGAIPDDTQEPDVAKGGDASRTPGITFKERAFKERAKSDDRRPSTPRSAAAAQPKPVAKTAKSGREIKVGDADDPLAGVR